MPRTNEKYSQLKTILPANELVVAQGLLKDSRLIASEDPETRQLTTSRVTGSESSSSVASRYVIAEVGMPFSDDPLRPYENVDATLSVLAGRQLLEGDFRTIPVVRVGNPGINHLSQLGQPSELTRDQKRELHSGMFVGVGQVCARALVATLDQAKLLDRKVILLQRSMSVSIGIAAVRQLLEYDVDLQGVALSEGVTYDPRSVTELAARFIATGSDAEKYLDQNPALCRANDESPAGWGIRTVRDGVTNFRYGTALAKGGFTLDANKTRAIEALRDSNTPVAFINGSGSKLSPSKHNDHTADMLDRAGVSVKRHEWPHQANHGLTMTLGDNLKALELLTQ